MTSPPARIVLYGRPYNRTDRVQWTLEELGVPYEYVVLDVFGLEHRQPEFRRRYGLTRLPFVELDGEVLFESGAIMVHLAETFRDRAALLPPVGDPDRPAVLQWLFFALSTLEASDEDAAPGSEPSPFAPLADTLAFVDRSLEGREFVAAGRFTLADIALANGLKWFGREAMAPFPTLTAYFRRHIARPAYRRIVAQPEYPRSAADL